MLVLLMRSSCSGILSKGGKLPPGSIRVWGGVKYVKTAPGKWRRLVGGKEPWNSSTEKAKTLTIKDFGSLEEVREMAKPIRSAHNREEATNILRQIAGKGALQSKNGIQAVLPMRNISKIVSDVAILQSVSREAHYLAAANLDKLFSNAIEPWRFELNPNKNNQDLKERRIFYAPLEYTDRIILVKTTVKEFTDPARGIKIYSLEAIDAVI
jgi:hypothetical protein